MNYSINNEMKTKNVLNNVAEFCRVNKNFNGKISAKDQRIVFGENVFGRKTVEIKEKGVIRVTMTANYRGDEIDEVKLSQTGRVFDVTAGYWGGKGIPEVGEYWW